MRGRYDFDPSAPILGTMASCEIVVDRYHSHNHLVKSMEPEVASLVLENALHTINAQEQDYIIAETVCSEPSLRTSCVATADDDEIVYAYRRKRIGQTRFVLGRDPEPTDSITTILKRDETRPGIMVLITAMAGPPPEPEPWDPQLTDEDSRSASILFWATHALVWDPESVDFSKNFGRELDIEAN